MEQLISFYQSMPAGIQYIANFFFSVIIMRGIVANELLKEGRKLWKQFKIKYAQFEATGNRMVIGSHYTSRTHGTGHSNADVLACREGTCASLLTTQVSVLN